MLSFFSLIRSTHSIDFDSSRIPRTMLATTKKQLFCCHTIVNRETVMAFLSSAPKLLSPNSSRQGVSFLKKCSQDSLLRSLNAESIYSVAVDDSVAPSVVFEPVLDTTAFATFLVISIVFAALIIRTQQVENVVQHRNQALERLRVVKSKELEGSDEIQEQDVQKALKEYEDAVRKEEKLRNIIPGVVRIVPPSAADEKEEEARVVAKQFLGKDFDIGISKREEVESKGSILQTIASLAVLALFMLQGVLFFFVTDDSSVIVESLQ